MGVVDPKILGVGTLGFVSLGEPKVLGEPGVFGVLDPGAPYPGPPGTPKVLLLPEGVVLLPPSPLIEFPCANANEAVMHVTTPAASIFFQDRYERGILHSFLFLVFT